MHRSILTAVFGSLLLSACGAGTEIGDEPTGEAQLRAVHAAPDAPAVDIYVAGEEQPLISNLAYGEATHYLTLPAGEYEIEIRAAGAGAATDPVFTDIIALQDGDRASAIAAGLLAASDPNSQFRLVALTEDFAAPAPGSAVVRVVHAGADAPAVGLDVGADGSVEVTDLERFTDTAAAGIELPAGQSLRVGVTAGFPAAEVTTFSLPALTDGGEFLVIATGLLSESATAEAGFSLLAVTPTATARVLQDPIVFALHASPDAPAVDLFTPDTVLLQRNLSFGQLSAPIRVSPGSQSIDFWPAGIEHGAAPAASGVTSELEPGAEYLVVATGFLAPAAGEAPFQLLTAEDEFDRADGLNARIRIVHASPNAPTVDVGPLGSHGLSALLVDDLPFSNSTQGKGISVAPQAIDIGVADSSSGAVAASFAIEPAAGLRAFVVAAGALGQGAGRAPFGLIVVDTAVFPWAATAVPAS